MADVHGSPASEGQMPQAGTPGSAPVPYAGPDLRGTPLYAVELGPMGAADGGVMTGVSGPTVHESAAAHSLAALDVSGDAPYYPGPLAPVQAHGDADAGGRDDVAGDVAAAVANATARWRELQGDLGQGSVIGDLMTFPPGPLDPGAGVGNTAPMGGFYDPPREYT